MSQTSTPKVKDLGVLSSRVEDTKGTAMSLGAAQGGLEAYDPQIGWNLPVAERDPLRPYHDPEQSVPAGPRWYTLNVGVACKGASAAGAAPEFDALLRACGLAKSVSAGTSVTYTPIAAVESQETATIGLYLDGIKYLLAGAMGDATFRFEQGATPMVDFALQGVYANPAAATIPTGTELHNVTPPSVDAITCTYRSTALVATAVTVALQNAIVPRKDFGVSGGVRHFLKRGINVQITVDPEVDPIGTRDFLSQITSGTAGEFVIAVGTAAGNTITITCPMVQVVTAGPQDRDGIMVYSLTLLARAASPSGNDSISIQFS